MGFDKNEWLKSVKHTIHEDGSISVDGDVNFTGKDLTEIPFNFKHVWGSFRCYNNKLTSLKGCPTSVGGNFECGDNKLKFSEEDIENAIEKSKRVLAEKEKKSRKFSIKFSPSNFPSSHCPLLPLSSLID